MPTLMNNIPEELRELQRWVCANADSKRPMKCFENTAASVSKPGTWGDFEEALEAIENGIYEYAGFVFDDDGYIGIDIDHAFDEDGLLSDEAVEAINACGSYTELSKSGKGLHIICKGTIPFKGKNNREGWEIYKQARFFVLTGKTVKFNQIVEAQSGIDAVLEKHFKDTTVEHNGEFKDRIWKPRWSIDDSSGAISVDYDEISSGSRHLSLVSYCGAIHSGGAHKSTVLKAAIAANEQYMNPPVPLSEVKQVVDSVTKYRR